MILFKIVNPLKYFLFKKTQVRKEKKRKNSDCRVAMGYGLTANMAIKIWSYCIDKREHTYCSVLHGTHSQPSIKNLNLMHQQVPVFQFWYS